MHLELKNITIGYSDFIIENLSLSVNKGKMFVLLGHSGSGKSTLINAIAGFVKLTSGNIFLNDEDITFKPTYLRNIGMVFQDFALFPHLSVYDNIAFSLKIKKKSKQEINRKIDFLLELIDLKTYHKRRIYQLSGGEKQRVALARTIAAEPELILFDEPLSSLDEILRLKLREKILDIQNQVKFTAIYVTHDQEEAFYLADSIGVMSNGNLIQQGNAEDVYACPKSKIVADFLGFKNRINCIVSEIYKDYILLRYNELTFKITNNNYNLLINQNVFLLIKASYGYFTDFLKTENSYQAEIFYHKYYASIVYVKLKLGSLYLETKLNRNHIIEEVLKNRTNLVFNLPLNAFSIIEDE